MSLDQSILVRTDWVDVSGVVRMKFRRDGTGYYEREADENRRFVHENLLWKVENGMLHLKFARARLWTDVTAETRTGTPSEDGRLGENVLALGSDPYARAVEDTHTAPLVLSSDRGAALPSS